MPRAKLHTEETRMVCLWIGLASALQYVQYRIYAFSVRKWISQPPCPYSDIGHFARNRIRS